MTGFGLTGRPARVLRYCIRFIDAAMRRRNLYAWMLMWTYNPYVLRARKGLDIEWYGFRIDREEFLARYAGKG